MNNAKDTDIHPAFIDLLTKLSRDELAKMAIQMQRAGDKPELIKVVVDEIKKRKS